MLLVSLLSCRIRTYGALGLAWTSATAARITHGIGAASVVKPANKADAPTVPSRLYICPANSGNAAADDVRTKVFEDIADAAIGRYAVTRYVKIAEKQNRMPVPKGTDAMMGTTQCTCGYVVNASQNRLTGMRTAPHMPMTRRISGGGCPSQAGWWSGRGGTRPGRRCRCRAPGRS